MKLEKVGREVFGGEELVSLIFIFLTFFSWRIDPLSTGEWYFEAKGLIV